VLRLSSLGINPSYAVPRAMGWAISQKMVSHVFLSPCRMVLCGGNNLQAVVLILYIDGKAALELREV
jgi:hypothetical protein